VRRYEAPVSSAGAFIRQAADCGAQRESLVIIATAIDDELSHRRNSTMGKRELELTNIELFFSTEESPLLIAQDAASGSWASIEIHDNKIFIEVTS
jgi:hypothetical protein